jgi:hypothetical protein
VSLVHVLFIDVSSTPQIFGSGRAVTVYKDMIFEEVKATEG